MKSEGEILVCLGNPPYDRTQRNGNDDEPPKGGWVRFGDQVAGAARQEKQGIRPIFEDFLEPARKTGKGLHLQVVFNDYVYFWRWALWRLFEQQDGGGIVSFITASSYLKGPGFSGVRQLMRQTFDDLWIIDLGGDNLGARKTPNVFSIRSPVAIAVGVRGRKPNPDVPATVRYARIDARTRQAKLGEIDTVKGFDSIIWRECAPDWQAAFQPSGQGTFFDWPKLTDIFPFHTAGAVYYRNWPIAESPDVLQSRWEKLTASPATERKVLYKESRDRKIDYIVRRQDLPGYGEPCIRDVTAASGKPPAVRYGYRSFDRQYALFDFRLGDYLRPALHLLSSEKQLFIVSPDATVPGAGPLVTVSAHIPDQHIFCGRGGKDIMPLYRDREGREPNVAGGLLDMLGKAYGMTVPVEDLAAYVYALLGGQSYARRFWNELETPGPRVPVTKDAALFAEAAALGRRLIWLHTWAERFRGDGRGDYVPAGRARCTAPVPHRPALYPDKFRWSESGREICIGPGRFGPVAPEIWNFEVSGLLVVQSWLGYRMKKRAGRKSSPLDNIRPERWTPRMTEELLELLWVLEATLDMEPELESVLDRVVASPCFGASELPAPSEEQRKPPAPTASDNGFL